MDPGPEGAETVPDGTSRRHPPRADCRAGQAGEVSSVRGVPAGGAFAAEPNPSA